jgi:hypothetical protein
MRESQNGRSGGKVDYPLNCPQVRWHLLTHDTHYIIIYIHDHVIMCTVWIYIRVSSNEKREKKRENLTQTQIFVRIFVYRITLIPDQM